MDKFKMTPTVPTGKVDTARVGASASLPATAEKNLGKFFKFNGDSEYAMCAVGDPIQGVLIAVEPATMDGYPIGSIQKDGRVEALCDGLQATPGTGSIAVGDFVVAGTVVADGTALTTNPKVCKATWQPGVTEATAVGDVNDIVAVAMHPWRVVSLGDAGAVGDTCVIERV